MPTLNFAIQRQPDDTTCGPTCLEAVYRYYDDPVPLATVIDEVRKLDEGGTLAVLLADHALRRGYRTTIYTYNLHVFDPSWFIPQRHDVAMKLQEQAAVKRDAKLQLATAGYLEYLRLGGVVEFEPLTREFLIPLLRPQRPVLTGLSATYLYQEPRELPHIASTPDDIRGVATGHFVVLYGYDPTTEYVRIADPLHPNRHSQVNTYQLHIDIVLGAIMLGVMTYDANLLVIEPPARTG